MQIPDKTQSNANDPHKRGRMQMTHTQMRITDVREWDWDERSRYEDGQDSRRRSSRAIGDQRLNGQDGSSDVEHAGASVGSI